MSAAAHDVEFGYVIVTGSINLQRADLAISEATQHSRPVLNIRIFVCINPRSKILISSPSLTAVECVLIATKAASDLSPRSAHLNISSRAS